jgi:hypothetical protein
VQAQAKAEKEKAAKVEAAIAAARAAAAADAAAAEASTAQVYPKKKPGAQKNMLKGARMAFASNPPGALPNKITFSRVHPPMSELWIAAKEPIDGIACRVWRLIDRPD